MAVRRFLASVKATSARSPPASLNLRTALVSAGKGGGGASRMPGVLHSRLFDVQLKTRPLATDQSVMIRDKYARISGLPVPM